MRNFLIKLVFIAKDSFDKKKLVVAKILLITWNAGGFRFLI